MAVFVRTGGRLRAGLPGHPGWSGRRAGRGDARRLGRGRRRDHRPGGRGAERGHHY